MEICKQSQFDDIIHTIETEKEAREKSFFQKLDDSFTQRDRTTKILRQLVKKYSAISSNLKLILEQLPVAFISVDLSGDVLITSDQAYEEGDTSSIDEKNLLYNNAFNWDQIWDVYNEKGEKLLIEEYPVVKALKTKCAVKPSNYMSISKKNGDVVYNSIWAEPVFDNGQLIGSSVFFCLISKERYEGNE